MRRPGHLPSAIPGDCHHPGKSEWTAALGTPEPKFLFGWEVETGAGEGTGLPKVPQQSWGPTVLTLASALSIVLFCLRPQSQWCAGGSPRP